MWTSLVGCRGYISIPNRALQGMPRGAAGAVVPRGASLLPVGPALRDMTRLPFPTLYPDRSLLLFYLIWYCVSANTKLRKWWRNPFGELCKEATTIHPLHILYPWQPRTTLLEQRGDKKVPPRNIWSLLIALSVFVSVCASHRGLEWNSWNKYAVKCTPPSSPALCTRATSSPSSFSPTPRGTEMSGKPLQRTHIHAKTTLPCRPWSIVSC